MPNINVARREISCKLVYYGPGLSGKTTNLEVVYKKAPEEKRGPLTNIATQGDRTLFFDFMPLDLGMVGGMKVKLQLYTVPGQAYYKATRRLVLQGVDGVVFVADSRPEMMEDNLASFEDLHDNLREHGIKLSEVPHILQYNKRDMPNVLSLEALDEALNPYGAPSFEAIAVTGEGVFPTLRMLSQLVLEDLRNKFGVVPTPSDREPDRRSRRPGAVIPQATPEPSAAADPESEVAPSERRRRRPGPTRSGPTRPRPPEPSLPQPVHFRPAAPEPAPRAKIEPVRTRWFGLLVLAAIAALTTWILLRPQQAWQALGWAQAWVDSLR